MATRVERRIKTYLMTYLPQLHNSTLYVYFRINVYVQSHKPRHVVEPSPTPPMTTSSHSRPVARYTLSHNLGLGGVGKFPSFSLTPRLSQSWLEVWEKRKNEIKNGKLNFYQILHVKNGLCEEKLRQSIEQKEPNNRHKKEKEV